MRLLALVLLIATTVWAERARFGSVSFELPSNWQARAVQKTPTAAAPIDDTIFELTPKKGAARAQLIVYAKKVSDGELEAAAGERHQARVKNRVAWGMKASSGPPREAVKLGARRAVRWHDRVGGALGASEQIMTCAVVSQHLACVVSTAPEEDRDRAEALSATVLSSLRR